MMQLGRPRVRRSRRDREIDALVRAGQICGRCRDSYKRGIDGTCTACGAPWPLDEKTPAGADTPTRVGPDAVEPGASANLDSARRGHNA
jgi:hypothetical protein